MAKKRTKKQNASFADRICNIIPSRDVQRDWRFEDALTAGALGAPAALPPKVDLRAEWWKINDQENTGSCVGWATADGVMRYMLVKANRLQKHELLSPRFNWMASKETDEFTTRPETFIVRGGYAVCVVGYTSDRFIVRNSWGTGWGDKGFGFASHNYINAAFFAESYGVTL